MAHLSFQPLKWELAQLRRFDVVTISTNLPPMDLKLPEFRPSPIRHSFIAQIITNSLVPNMLSALSPILAEEHEQDTVEVRQLNMVALVSHHRLMSHDIGAATLLTAGCYVFGVEPSAYPIGVDSATNASRYLDVPTQLLDTAISKKPTAFAGVPWVLEGFMKAWKNELDAMRMQM